MVRVFIASDPSPTIDSWLQLLISVYKLIPATISPVYASSHSASILTGGHSWWLQESYKLPSRNMGNRSCDGRCTMATGSCSLQESEWLLRCLKLNLALAAVCCRISFNQICPTVSVQDAMYWNKATFIQGLCLSHRASKLIVYTHWKILVMWSSHLVLIWSTWGPIKVGLQRMWSFLWIDLRYYGV